MWLGVRQYNQATAQKVDPKFILSWGLEANKQISQAIGVVIALVGIGLGLGGAYYLFSG